MSRRIAAPNIIDLLAGLSIIAIGALGVWEAITLPLGSLSRMGPGYFPFCLGILLIGLGIGIVFSDSGSIEEEEQVRSIAMRPLLFISAGILAFGFLIERSGLVPAIFTSVVISSLADPRKKLTNVLILAVTLSIFCAILFIEVLGVPMRILKW